MIPRGEARDQREAVKITSYHRHSGNMYEYTVQGNDSSAHGDDTQFHLTMEKFQKNAQFHVCLLLTVIGLYGIIVP